MRQNRIGKMLKNSMLTVTGVLVGVLVSFMVQAATLSGPVTGGTRGAPFAAVDVSDAGYVTEEYFLEGEAGAFELTEGTHTGDGMWKTRASSDRTPYKTRILVVRPESAAAFNGTVIVFWQNVTAGYELGSAGGEALRGYAWVGVSAQKVGIDGMGENPAGLKAWDPERYGSLRHPGDDWSYDIFTQAALAVGPGRDHSGIDPMDGLKVERLLAVGASQSAARLRTYINGVHPLVGVFDGFLPFIDFGSVVPFARDAGQAGMGRARASIRADLDVPVMVVNSETELMTYHGIREADTDRFRLWEVPGTSHVSVPRPESRTVGGANWHSFSPVYNAAIRQLHRWIRDGTAPPMMPRVEMVAVAGSFPEILRDEHGNAKGGIRLPDLVVPTASHSGMGQRREGNRFAFLYGTATDFDQAQLAAMYSNSKLYLEAWNAQLKRLVDEGVVLAEDADLMRQGAEKWAMRLDRK
jgi:hypothetical protein